jgi:hypothetical protein
MLGVGRKNTIIITSTWKEEDEYSRRAPALEIERMCLSIQFLK